MSLTVAAAYGCAISAAEEAKDSLYDDLQDVIDCAMLGDILVVARDCNSRPGPMNMATRHILGKFALATRHANGDRLVNFASANEMEAHSRIKPEGYVGRKSTLRSF